MKRTVLVPCKALGQGKSRLAPCMGSAARKALCQAFLDRTLDLARGIAAPEEIRVVTSDPAAMAMARRHGVAVIGDAGNGLNDALDAARAAVVGNGEDHEVMVLPIDLPLATPAILEKVLATTCDVAIVPDEPGLGTNGLLLRARAAQAFPFAFGPDSFARHSRQAASMGFSVAIVEDDRLGFDVDSPEQFVRWMGQRGHAALASRAI